VHVVDIRIIIRVKAEKEELSGSGVCALVVLERKKLLKHAIFMREIHTTWGAKTTMLSRDANLTSTAPVCPPL